MHVNYHQITFPISVMRAASEKGLDFAGHEFFSLVYFRLFRHFSVFFSVTPVIYCYYGCQVYLKIPDRLRFE